MGNRPRVTATDGYKFSMAESGAALRHETFYYSHRRGGISGWHYMPLDVSAFVKDHLPVVGETDYAFLSANTYDVGAAVRKAFTLTDKVSVKGVPKGAWFYNREPAFSVTGPSAIASWFEPTTLMLNFRIQIATAALGNDPNKFDKIKYATCDEERDIIKETLDSLGVRCPEIEVRQQEYVNKVHERAKGLVGIVKDPDRIFEVGMRAVSCMRQHELALEAIRSAGILRTSNVYLAQKLKMIPIGTMGHEHVQRFGDDYEAFVAMRDRFPGFLFYLPDTFDTTGSGVPSALLVIAEQPWRNAGIRFDSEQGIRGHYMFTVAKAREKGLSPILALESGWNDVLTTEFEQLREIIKWPADRQAYGIGGYLVKPPWDHFGRDDVQAVWKICQTGSRATMKFGDEPKSGKQSIPGLPVIMRPHPLQGGVLPAGFIVQENEDWIPPFECKLLTGAEPPSSSGFASNQDRKVRPLVYSPETQKLVDVCIRNRQESISRAMLRG